MAPRKNPSAIIAPHAMLWFSWLERNIFVWFEEFLPQPHKMEQELAEYLQAPWEQKQQGSWWVVHVNKGFKLPATHKLVVQFRVAMLSLKTAQDAWTLRLIASEHPLVVLDSLPLLLARCGGICQRKQLDDDVFLLGLSEDQLSFVAEYESVMDVLECSSASFEELALHSKGDEHFSQVIRFVVFLLCFAEGKQQRLALRPVVLRAVGLMYTWMHSSLQLAQIVKQGLKQEFDSNAERVSGMFDRTAYYYRESVKAEWLAKNWKDYEPTSNPREVIVATERLFAHGSDYEALYNKAVVHPMKYMSADMDQDLLTAWTLSRANDKYLIALTLYYFYTYPSKFRTSRALLAKLESCTDARVIAFFGAIKLLQT